MGQYKALDTKHEDDIHMFDIKNRLTSTASSINESSSGEGGRKWTKNRQPIDHRATEMTTYDRLKDKMESVWFFEILAILLSLGCIVAVIWLLLALDNKPYVPKQYGLSPNTLISLLITAAKSLLMLAVANGVGQLRWLYYQSSPRRLDGLDMFDGASRGPWGAVCYLWFMTFGRGKTRIIGSWGAVLVIVALAMDPFAQNILSFPSRDVEISEVDAAWIPACKGHDLVDQTVVSDDRLRKAVYGGLLNLDLPIPFGCLSGNCTWPPFMSLGVCTSCTDDSTTASRSCFNGSGVLDVNCTQIQYTGTSANVSLILQNGSTVLDPNDSEQSKKYTLIKSSVSKSQPKGARDPALFSFMLAALDVDLSDGANNTGRLANPNWTMTTCTVSQCAKLYEDVQAINNILINTEPKEISVHQLANSTCQTNQSCVEYVPDPSYPIPPNSPSSFRIAKSDTNVEIRNLMSFDYNITTAASNPTFGNDNLMLAYNFASTFFLKTNVTTAFQHISRSYTNYLRANDAHVNITGVATVRATYVRVTWSWFALPAAVVLLSAGFLITVIIYTHWKLGSQALLWKRATLPLLFHGLNEVDRGGEGSGKTNTVAEMDARARGVIVRLERNAEGDIGFMVKR